MKYKVLTLASAAAMLAACSDTSISDGNDQIKDGATVVITTYDALTKLPLEDVKVFYRHDDKTKKTDSAGTIVWKNIEIGTQWFDFQYDGYAFKRVPVTVSDNIQNDVARVDDVNEEISMYENGVDANGQLYYVELETGDWKPAVGATVYAKYTGDADIYPNEVYTTTDSAGNYSFSNLASNVEITISSERFVLADDSSRVYDEVSFPAFTLRKGSTEEVIPQAAAIVGNKPVLLASNMKSIELKDNLTMTFSKALNKDSLKTKYFWVEKSGVEVATSLSLSENGKTVTVKPASGKWVDQAKYTVKFRVWSADANVENKDTQEEKEFSIGKTVVPGQVKNLAIKKDDSDEDEINIGFSGTRTYVTLHDEKDGELDASNDTIKYVIDVTLEWDEIEKGVDGFKIYAKGDSESDVDYKLIDKVADGSATEKKIQIDEKMLGAGKKFAYPMAKKQLNKVSIIVLPYNDAGTALAKDAKAITLTLNDLVEEKLAAYAEAAVQSTEQLTWKSGSYCSDAETCTNTTLKSYAFDGAYFKMNYTVSWKWDKDETLKPSGFDIYVYNSETKEWKFATSVTAGIYTADVNWIFEKALKTSTEKSTEAEVYIMPYFNSTDGKISGVEINKSLKNYVSRTYADIAK